MIQTTFTKQKRELAKATAWLQRVRAMETRKITFDAERNKLTEVRENYVDFAPEEIAGQIFDIVVEVVGQHGARQQANSRNTGRFDWQGVQAELTVPQLRALQDSHAVLSELANTLPRRNPRLIPNATVEGRPAFQHPEKQHFEEKSRFVPFEEDNTTRVRTYEERYKELAQITQMVEIDYGVDNRRLEQFQTMVLDLGTAIQVAIDEANTKGSQPDPTLNGVISAISQKLRDMLPPPTQTPTN